MSTDNAVKFLQAMNTDKTLCQSVMDGAATNYAWVASAARAGYEITAEELRSVAEQLVGKPLTPDALVGALRSTFDGELAEAALGSVSGGARGTPAVRATLAMRLSGLGVRLASGDGGYVKEGSTLWVNSPGAFGGRNRSR